MQSGIKVTNLHKNFNGVEALKGVNLEITQPGLYGLIGPNGAGKSTLFKCITGLLNPSIGQVYIDGAEVNPRHLEHRLKFGFLPEDSGTYDKLTARDFLHVIAAMSGIKKSERGEKVKEVIDFIGITYSPNKIVKYLSTGQKRLLLIASVLLHNPGIVILDESLNGLDPINRDKVSQVMKKISENRIVFFSSHVLADIWRLCEKIYVLNGGSLMKVDTPKNILKEASSNAFYVTCPERIEDIVEFMGKTSYFEDIQRIGTKIVFTISKDVKINKILQDLLSTFDSIESFGPFLPDLDELFVKLVKTDE